jgi:hypothetical protein
MIMTEPVTPADATLSGFLQSIELAAVTAYDTVLTFLAEASKPAATKFQIHHREYANILATQAGASAATVANQTLTLVLASRLQKVTDERGALTFAFGLENQLAETYAFAFTTLTSSDVIRATAVILPIVSGHAAALASLAGLSTAIVFPNGPFEGSAVAGPENTDLKLGFDPATFPVG